MATRAKPLRFGTGGGEQGQLQDDDPAVETLLDLMLADPRQRNSFMSRMVAHGTPMMPSYLRELSKFSLVGRPAQITCPTLALEAEGDFANLGQLQAFISILTCPSHHPQSHSRGGGRRPLREPRPAPPRAHRLRLAGDHSC
jgi:hypothetical protein